MDTCKCFFNLCVPVGFYTNKPFIHSTFFNKTLTVTVNLADLVKGVAVAEESNLACLELALIGSNAAVLKARHRRHITHHRRVRRTP